MHGMLQQIRSIFETIPTKHTWSVNGFMTNKNIVGVSLYR